MEAKAQTNIMRLSNWWHNVHFWENYPFTTAYCFIKVDLSAY